MDPTTLTDMDFAFLRKLLRDAAGINLGPEKKALVVGRLYKRLQPTGCDSFGAYFRLIAQGPATPEWQIALDLLTTNETSFFREPPHFDYLSRVILAAQPPGQVFRVWSAACSSGEEPYSIAMVLAEHLGMSGWEIVASDISTRVLASAQRGLYDLGRARQIPEPYLKRYCLKGVGSQTGLFLIDKPLRERVRFMQVNLNAPLPKLGQFDLIFLRNVMIYFDLETKRDVVARLVATLRPGGHFFPGHSESLNGVTSALETVAPAIYRKP